MKSDSLEFGAVIAKLREWREQAKLELRSPEFHKEALHVKFQIDVAVKCLEFCQRHFIHPNAKVTVLPDTRTATPSSNYRILEDHETDDPQYWTELTLNGKPLHFCPGDIIIS